ncbi:MAG TPA: hypothetical protein VEB20_19080 [Azospirillaceae bacterium]|nr:hypothetical protein [Azospirillaceae bacterium]
MTVRNTASLLVALALSAFLAMPGPAAGAPPGAPADAAGAAVIDAPPAAPAPATVPEAEPGGGMGGLPDRTLQLILGAAGLVGFASVGFLYLRLRRAEATVGELRLQLEAVEMERLRLDRWRRQGRPEAEAGPIRQPESLGRADGWRSRQDFGHLLDGGTLVLEEAAGPMPTGLDGPPIPLDPGRGDAVPDARASGGEPPSPPGEEPIPSIDAPDPEALLRSMLRDELPAALEDRERAQALAARPDLKPVVLVDDVLSVAGTEPWQAMFWIVPLGTRNLVALMPSYRLSMDLAVLLMDEGRYMERQLSPYFDLEHARLGRIKVTSPAVGELEGDIFKLRTRGRLVLPGQV